MPARPSGPPRSRCGWRTSPGPFDLLLSLISKHQLDVTEVALSRVTDEFIAHIRALGSSWDLGQATEFLVVAATLLDLKAARLLPSAEVEDEEDLALLEARDLLFARLLQYRAYKQVAAHLGTLERAQSRRFGRVVPLEPRFAELMPELLLAVSPERLARIAAEALRPKPPPTVSIDHVHAARVSVREHASILRERLARTGRSTFRALTQDCEHTVELVARFLALLELYREGAVAFDQVAPLGELWVRWTGTTGAAEPTGTPGRRRGVRVSESSDGHDDVLASPPVDMRSDLRPPPTAADGAVAAPGGRPPGPGRAGGCVAGRRAGGRRGRLDGRTEGRSDRDPDPDALAGPDRLRAAVEAVLLVVDVPTSPPVLAQVLGRPVAEVEEALRALREEYDAGGRGLDLREIAEGWRLYSREDFAAYVERFVLDGQQARLTQAALETLAVIAYRQPVTRSRVSAHPRV